jgi:hypothetical protein
LAFATGILIVKVASKNKEEMSLNSGRGWSVLEIELPTTGVGKPES